MNGRRITVPTIGRAAGFILVVAAIVATAVHFRHERVTPPSAVTPQAPHADPLAAELARCQALGIAAQNDDACETAWTENRRRFFIYRPAGDAAPTAPAAPAASKSEDR